MTSYSDTELHVPKKQFTGTASHQPPEEQPTDSPPAQVNFIMSDPIQLTIMTDHTEPPPAQMYDVNIIMNNPIDQGQTGDALNYPPVPGYNVLSAADDNPVHFKDSRTAITDKRETPKPG